MYVVDVEGEEGRVGGKGEVDWCLVSCVWSRLTGLFQGVGAERGGEADRRIGGWNS
jgi:hypothetical protein